MSATASPPVAGVEPISLEFRVTMPWRKAGCEGWRVRDAMKRLDREEYDAVEVRYSDGTTSTHTRALASPVGGDGPLQAEGRPSVPSQREVRLVLAARAVAFGDHFSPSAIKELDAASEAYAADVPWEDEPEPHEPCGGCGESNPANRCIGCMHVFSPPPAASVSPGMETLQASECTKHGEGDQ